MANSLGSLVVRLGLNAAEYTTGLTQASTQAAGFARTTERSMQSVTRSVQDTTSAVDYLKRAFQFAAGAYGLKELKTLSDEYQNASARLSIFATSQDNLTRTLGALFGVAQNTRQSLSATVDLYYQLANATQDAGTSQKSLLDITSAINKGLIISGSTGDSAKGVIIQLSQALAAGKLRGQEFNTVNEQGNRILRALAEGLGKTVGELREMANDGAITTEVFVQGFSKGIAGIDRDFEKLPITITGGLTKVSNAIQQYVGTTFNAQGQTNLLAKTLDLTARNFDLLVAAVTGFLVLKVSSVIGGMVTSLGASVGALVTETAATRANTIAKIDATRAKLADLAATEATIVAARAQTVADLQALAASGAATAATRAKTAALVADLALLGRAQAGVAVQTATTTATLATLTAGTGLTARAMGAARGALGLVGGPLGAITIALGLGAAAWQYYSSSSEDAARKAKESTEDSTTDIIAALNKQITKIKERNKAALAGYDVKTSVNPDATLRVFKLTEELDRLKKSGSNVDKIAAIDVQASIDEINAGLETLHKELDIQENRGRSGKYSEWMLQYANDAEKMAAEIQKARNELGDKFTPELEKRIREKFTKKPPVDDNSRKILDGQIKAVEAELAREKDLLTGYEGFLRDTYAQGLQTVNEYYDKLQGARDEYLRKQLQSYDDEIVAAELFYQRSKKEVDKQDALNKIDDIKSKRVNLLRDAGIQEQALNRERSKANQEYLDQLGEINARLLEMNGNTAAATKIRLEAANRIQRAMLSRDTSPEAQAALAGMDALERQQYIQAQLTDETKKYSLVLGDLELMKQRIANDRDAGAATELEGLYRLSAANKEYIDKLKERLAVLEAIAATSKDPADLQRVQQLKVQLEAVANQTDLVAKKFNDLATNAIADGLYDIVTGAKSVSQAFKDMAKNISDAIARIAANNLAEAMFGKGSAGSGFGSFFSKMFAGNTGGSGDFFSWIASLFGFGGGGSSMLGAGYSFSGGGGGLGFAAGGTDNWRGGPLMVGENGPEMLTLPKGSHITPNHELGRMGHNYSITVNPPSGMSRESAQQFAVSVGREISRRVKRA